MKIRRKMISIDEDKCDGCGLCASACHEGALRIVDGKARLVSDIYCDGLGDCIGSCPRDAITFEEREAEAYDEEAVRRHLAKDDPAASEKPAPPLPCGCPGTAAQSLRGGASASRPSEVPACGGAPSLLGNWPVQLRLVPEGAPYLQEARWVLAADCAPFALGNFHGRFLAEEGTVCLVGCPKLDDAGAYRDKLARMIAVSHPREIVVVRMEVPCCGGLSWLLEDAVEEARVDLPVTTVVVGLRGDVGPGEVTRYRFRQ